MEIKANWYHCLDQTDTHNTGLTWENSCKVSSTDKDMAMFPIKIPLSEKSREFHLSLRLNIRKEGVVSGVCISRGWILHLTLLAGMVPAAALSKEKKVMAWKKGEKLLPCSRVSPFLQLSFPFFGKKTQQTLKATPYTTAVTSNPQLFAMTVAQWPILHFWVLTTVWWDII